MNRPVFWRTVRDVAGCPYLAVVLAAAGVMWLWDSIRRVKR